MDYRIKMSESTCKPSSVLHSSDNHSSRLEIAL